MSVGNGTKISSYGCTLETTQSEDYPNADAVLHIPVASHVNVTFRITPGTEYESIDYCFDNGQSQEYDDSTGIPCDLTDTEQTALMIYVTGYAETENVEAQVSLYVIMLIEEPIPDEPIAEEPAVEEP